MASQQPPEDARRYPGQNIGLPPSGPGSVASWTARLAALAVDWVIANLVTVLLVGPEVYASGSSQRWVPLAAWLLLGWVGLGATGATAGQHLLGLRVMNLDGGRPGPGSALLRTLLVALVVPPLVANGDGRGLHDLAVKTVVVRRR